MTYFDLSYVSYLNPLESYKALIFEFPAILLLFLET